MGTDTLPVYTTRAASEVDWAVTGLPLPPRLQRQIPKRIKMTAVLALTVSLTAFVFAVVLWRMDEPRAHSTLQFSGIALSILAASLAIRFVDRWKLRTAVISALVTEFFVCLFISIGNPAYELRLNQSVPGATWIVPIIIMVPFLIPTPPSGPEGPLSPAS